jgi:hypothetical protein
MFKGREQRNFISKEDCRYLIEYATSSDAWSFSEDDFWNNRVFYPETLPSDNELKIKMSSILKKAKSFIQSEYGLENVYADTFNYKKSQDPATFFGNWLSQTEKTVKEFKNINFFRVMEQGQFVPDKLQGISNLQHITYDNFEQKFKGSTYTIENHQKTII